MLTLLGKMLTLALAREWVGWNVFPMCQGCGFDPWSGHIQESIRGCTDG